ncbi:MAG: hypothetical protein KKH28_00030 [Elusimicrobia bacterium]|nr:hypothetical protein [Elusimicrobiota bacterium]
MIAYMSIQAEPVVLGDYAWLNANKAIKPKAMQLIKNIKARFGIDTYVLYFDKGVKSGSKPYRLLNINRLTG